MNNANGALAFDAQIQNTDFKRSIDEIERRVIGMTSTVVREGNKIDSEFKRLGQLAAGYFTFNALGDFAQQVVRVRGEFQQLEIAFTTMLGSKAKSDKFLQEGIEFAAKTPFNLTDVAKAQKQLLAYGFSADSIIPTLRKLGDISAGLSIPLGDLTYLYGTTATQGRLMTKDLDQFVGRGIPLIGELAKQFKIADKDVREFAESGKIGFKDVETAINSLTNGSGKINFGGLLAKQAESLTGLTANLGDAFTVMLNKIGQANEGVLAEGIKSATFVVENYEPVLDILKVLIATYGTYKAAVIAASVAQSAAAVTGNVVAWLQLATTIRSAKDAQIAFNLATSANPYAIAAAALIGLITAVALYKRELSTTEQAVEALQSARDKANTGVSSEVAKIEVLKTSINNEKLSRDQRNKALRDLIALSPAHLNALTLDAVKTNAGTKAIDAYIESKKRQIEVQEIEKELTDSITRQRDAQAGKNEVGILEKLKQAAASAGGEGSYDATKGTADANKRLNEQIVANETTYQAKLKERISALNEAGAAGTKAESSTQTAVKKTEKYYDDLIAAKKKAREEESTSSSDYARRTTEIERLEAQKRRLTGEMTAAEKKAAKEADKVGPYGSISYWENIAKKANEIIEKTPSDQTGKLAQQNAIKLNAEAQAEAIRKKNAIKSFEEEIDEKKKSYTLYQQWVEAYGQQSADVQFAKLKQSGQSFVDYLNTQIANLEDEKANAGLSDKQAQNLGSLLDQRDEATGKKTALESYRDELGRLAESAQSTTDYIKALENQLAAIPADNAPINIGKRLAVGEDLVAAQRQLKVELAQYLVSVTGSEEQRLAITKKYANLRAAVEAQYKNKPNDPGKASALATIDQGQKNEIKEVNEAAAQASEAYKKLDQVMLESGRAALKKRLALLDEYLKTEKDKTTQTYQQKFKERTDTELALNDDDLSRVTEYAQVIGQLGDALTSLGGTAGMAGGLLSGLASNVGLLTQAFKTNMSSAEGTQLLLQATVSILTSITSAAAQRKQKEVEYYREMIGQQKEYNQLLNEQIGTRSQKEENVFVKNYSGRIKDGIDQLNGAAKGYQDSLKKLSEGQAKIGQDNAIDFGAVGKNALAGAAIGTAIAGPIGTVVGGLIGGIAGIFGSKKKEDVFGPLLQAYPQLIQKSKDGVDELNVALAQTLIDHNQVDDATKDLLQDTIKWSEQIAQAKEQIKGVVSELAGGLGDDLRDSLVGAFEDGTDAAKAFAGSVGKVMEKVVSQILFNKIFNDQFDQLEKDLTNSLATGGTGADAFAAFYSKASGLSQQFDAALEAAQKAAANAGLTIFSGSGSGSQNNNNLTGGIKSVTEETASVLAGNITAMRIMQALIEDHMKSQLVYLANIEVNTYRITETNDKLERVVDRLDRMYNGGVLAGTFK